MSWLTQEEARERVAYYLERYSGFVFVVENVALHPYGMDAHEGYAGRLF